MCVYRVLLLHMKGGELSWLTVHIKLTLREKQQRVNQ